MSETANNGPAKSASLSERVRSLSLSSATEPEPSGGSRWWWVSWGLCGVLFCVAGLFAMEALSPIDDDMIKKIAEERGLNVGKGGAAPAVSLAGLGVKSQPNDSAALEISLESKGNIIPASLIQVSPKIGGTVVKLNFKEGDEVQEDQVLAVLEDVEFRSDYDRAKAVKEAAEGRLGELKKFLKDEIEQSYNDWKDTSAQRDQAHFKYQRAIKLKGLGSVAPEDFEAAKSTFESYDYRSKRLELTYRMMKEAGKGPRYEKIAAAEAEVRQAKAELDKAEWRFKNVEVRAPKTSRGKEAISYIILTKKTEEGNIVNPSAFSNGLSASLCEMANLRELLVDLAIAERDIAKLFKNQECRIRPEAYSGRIYRGFIWQIMPVADRSKSSVTVRVMVQFPAIDGKGEPLPAESQGEYLRPEMGAIVTFLNRKVAANEVVREDKDVHRWTQIVNAARR
jgi:multidrug efflux pump subunit AcrA (membrane-fusion protein)